MHCFVLPSQTEGTSCTIQEAMSCGRPVVATAVGGTPELIDHARTGLLVPSDDESALADAIWRCAQDAQLCANLGAAARAQALLQFGLQSMVAQYESLWS